MGRRGGALRGYQHTGLLPEIPDLAKNAWSSAADRNSIISGPANSIFSRLRNFVPGFVGLENASGFHRPKTSIRRGVKSKVAWRSRRERDSAPNPATKGYPDRAKISFAVIRPLDVLLFSQRQIRRDARRDRQRGEGRSSGRRRAAGNYQRRSFSLT